MLTGSVKKTTSSFVLLGEGLHTNYSKKVQHDLVYELVSKHKCQEHHHPRQRTVDCHVGGLS